MLRQLYSKEVLCSCAWASSFSLTGSIFTWSFTCTKCGWVIVLFDDKRGRLVKNLSFWRFFTTFFKNGIQSITTKICHQWICVIIPLWWIKMREKKRVWRKNEKLCFDYNDKEAATFYGYENISLNCDLRVFNTWEADLWSFEAQDLTL